MLRKSRKTRISVESTPERTPTERSSPRSSVLQSAEDYDAEKQSVLSTETGDNPTQSQPAYPPAEGPTLEKHKLAEVARPTPKAQAALPPKPRGAWARLTGSSKAAQCARCHWPGCGKDCYFLVFVQLFEKYGIFNREKYGTNRESVILQSGSAWTSTWLRTLPSALGKRQARTCAASMRRLAAHTRSQFVAHQKIFRSQPLGLSASCRKLWWHRHCRRHLLSHMNGWRPKITCGWFVLWCAYANDDAVATFFCVDLFLLF
eukprot:SAG31_NODE_1274_length_9050_cov_10.910178_11_plen_261_part_00